MSGTQKKKNSVKNRNNWDCWNSASYGGFETAVENIIKYPGAKFTVYCSSRHYVLKIENFNGASLEYVPLRLMVSVSSMIYIQ